VTSFTLPVAMFIRLGKLQVVLTFESVSEILWCDHSNETSLAELLNNTNNFFGFYKYKKVTSFVFFLFTKHKK